MKTKVKEVAKAWQFQIDGIPGIDNAQVQNVSEIDLSGIGVSHQMGSVISLDAIVLQDQSIEKIKKALEFDREITLVLSITDPAGEAKEKIRIKAHFNGIKIAGFCRNGDYTNLMVKIYFGVKELSFFPFV